jgi:putative ABC transport system permease protein
LQYTSSIAVIIGLIVITKQIDYVKNKDLGFNTEHLVRIPVHWKAKDKVDVLKNKLQSIAGIKNVCYSHGTPGSIWNYSNNDEFGHVSVITSDDDFIKTFNLNILQGRNFYQNEQGRVCLINQKAMQQAGWEDYYGKKMFGAEVIGIINEFHFKDLYNEIDGLMIENGKDVSHITLRLHEGNITDILGQVEKGFNEVLPDFEFDYQFYDDFFNSLYKQEEKRASAINNTWYSACGFQRFASVCGS